MLLDRCFLTVSLAIPVAVMLSQCMGIGGCLCPISYRVILMILPSLVFMNNAASSASAADATTNFRIPHMMNIAPFNLIGLPFSDTLPINNSPAILLVARDSERYGAFEWMFNIMSEA